MQPNLKKQSLDNLVDTFKKPLSYDRQRLDRIKLINANKHLWRIPIH